MKIPLLLLLLIAGLLPTALPAKDVPIQNAAVFFSRSTDISPIIVKQIDNSTRSVYLAMYALTDRNIADALIRASSRGVDVRIVLDSSEAKQANSCAATLIQSIGANRVLLGHGLGRYGIMHEKMGIIDARLVILGSYNWTYQAAHDNWENIMFFNSSDLATECTLEFGRIFTYAQQSPGQ